MNYYVSDWGSFKIPDDIFKATKFTETMCEGWDEGAEYLQKEVAKIPENWPFFKWLHEQEVAAGKPEP